MLETTFESNIQRIYEVNLEYPEELHDLPNEAPESMVVDTPIYSDYQRVLANKLKMKFMLNLKLIPNLLNISHYSKGHEKGYVSSLQGEKTHRLN